MEGTDIKVINQRNVIDNDFDFGDNFINHEKYIELRAFTIFPGDILITTRGTIGRTAIFPNKNGTSILHPCLMRLQVDEKYWLKGTYRIDHPRFWILFGATENFEQRHDN